MGVSLLHTQTKRRHLMPSDNSSLTSSIASSVIVISMSMASAAFATDIHRPDEMVSVSSGDAVMLQSVDVTTWTDEAVPAPTDAPTCLHEAQDRLDELAHLSDDWAGREKPNSRALEMALSLIKRMDRHGYKYLRIAPMADGGYLEGERLARFDVYNDDDGGIVVVTRDGRDARPEYKELSEADAVDEMSQFLQNNDATAAG